MCSAVRCCCRTTCTCLYGRTGCVHGVCWFCVFFREGMSVLVLLMRDLNVYIECVCYLFDNVVGRVFVLVCLNLGLYEG